MAMQGADEFETWARRYWSAWGDSLRSAQSPDAAAVPGWNEALTWWSQLARGGIEQGDDAISRFSTQAQGWFGQMQQLAAQFAGQPATAAEVAAAWKQMLGGDQANPFAGVLGTVPGALQADPSRWSEALAPLLREGRSWLQMPAFGFAREHQERWQQLAQAQLDVQEQGQAYQALLAEAAQDAFARFERKLEERSQPGQQIDSVRALFDLWIDAAEEAYADVALSPRFRDAYAAMVNAQMTLRARMQKEVEQLCAQWGMPTRTEVDSAHRKIVQMERELRRLRDLLESGRASAEPSPERESASAVPPSRVRPVATKKPVAKKTASKKAAPKRPASKKAASKSEKSAAKPASRSATRVTRKR